MFTQIGNKYTATLGDAKATTTPKGDWLNYTFTKPGKKVKDKMRAGWSIKYWLEELESKFRHFALTLTMDGWEFDNCKLTKDGMTINLHLSQGRWRVSGDYPDNNYCCEHPHITLAYDTTPGKIVSEIQRRFLPGYLVAYAKEKARKEQDDNYAALTESTQAAIEATGLVHRHYGPNGSYIQIEGDGVRFERIGKMMLKQAIQILAILKEYEE